MKRGKIRVLVADDDPAILELFENEFSAIAEVELSTASSGYRAGFETTITIKRSDFDITTYIDNGGLGDEVRLMISIEGVKQG